MSDTHTLNDTEQNYPPRDAAVDNDKGVYSAVTGAAAASADIWAGYTAHPVTGLKTPEGRLWIEVEALTTPAYVRFTTTASAATTVNTGTVIPAGSYRRFYVDGSKDLFMDHISSGAGVVKWRKVGAICHRSRI